jgi:hypothetical protein
VKNFSSSICSRAFKFHTKCSISNLFAYICLHRGFCFRTRIWFFGIFRPQQKNGLKGPPFQGFLNFNFQAPRSGRQMPPLLA